MFQIDSFDSKFVLNFITVYTVTKYSVYIIPFEYDRAGTVLALARQYNSRSHVRKALRGESFHVLESSQVLIPSACLKTTADVLKYEEILKVN